MVWFLTTNKKCSDHLYFYFVGLTYVTIFNAVFLSWPYFSFEQLCEVDWRDIECSYNSCFKILSDNSNFQVSLGLIFIDCLFP